MSKEAIAEFGMGKATNSRSTEDIEVKEQESVYSDTASNQDTLDDANEIAMDDDGRDRVELLRIAANTAYKAKNTQSGVVRDAQRGLRNHHATNGSNNSEYVALANQLNTETQKLKDLEMSNGIAEAAWKNGKARFGRQTTF